MDMWKGSDHPFIAIVIFLTVLFGGAWILTTFAMEDIIVGLIIISLMLFMVWFVKSNWE